MLSPEAYRAALDECIQRGLFRWNATVLPLLFQSDCIPMHSSGLR
ncbi:MAG: hypothetical protein ACI841_003004 [Planctomycetota bacterium]|jgi:hypothetical protein